MNRFELLNYLEERYSGKFIDFEELDYAMNGTSAEVVIEYNDALAMDKHIEETDQFERFNSIEI